MEVLIHYKMKLTEFKPKNPIEKSVKPVHTAKCYHCSVCLLYSSCIGIKKDYVYLLLDV